MDKLAPKIIWLFSDGEYHVWLLSSSVYSAGAWLISDTELSSEYLDIYDLSRYLDTISIISVEV